MNNLTILKSFFATSTFIAVGIGINAPAYGALLVQSVILSPKTTGIPGGILPGLGFTTPINFQASISVKNTMSTAIQITSLDYTLLEIDGIIDDTIIPSTNVSVQPNPMLNPGQSALLTLSFAATASQLNSGCDLPLIGPTCNDPVGRIEEGLDLEFRITGSINFFEKPTTVPGEQSFSSSTPEPSSALSLLAFCTFGAASALKRKLSQKLIEKETTKVG